MSPEPAFPPFAIFVEGKKKAARRPLEGDEERGYDSLPWGVFKPPLPSLPASGSRHPAGRFPDSRNPRRRCWSPAACSGS